jgi:diadenosine tetraphosphate (Ap4A) HIT family hydrolase
MLNTQRKDVAARVLTNSAYVCKVMSGQVVLCGMQYLRGYSILKSDPVVDSLNSLDKQRQTEFLCDMALIGDALIEVTGAYRINYAIMGNTDPTLHAHIIPRYLDEPEERRKDGPWTYSKDHINSKLFEYERDKELIELLAKAIQVRQ